MSLVENRIMTADERGEREREREREKERKVVRPRNEWEKGGLV